MNTRTHRYPYIWTLAAAGLILILCATVWAARSDALTRHATTSTTEQPAGPAGSALTPDTTAPDASTQQPADPSTDTTTPAPTTTQPTQDPTTDPTVTPDPTTTTTPTAQEPTATYRPTPPPPTFETTTATPVCHVAGCPGA